MALVSDISHLFGNDIAVSPTGDIALVSGSMRTTQRVIRRLCTPQTMTTNSAYPWEPLYGCGLPEKIGDVLDPMAVRADVFSQLLQEAAVAPLPLPQVSVQAILGGGATIGCIYTDRSGGLQNFNFDLAP